MWAHSKKSGFTIVELLIVIVVIGILAAITLIAYNGIQNRAKLSSLQSDLETSGKILENYKITNAVANGSEIYPLTLSSAQTDAGIKASSGTTYTTYIPSNTSSPANYCLTATNSAGTYSITSTAKGPMSGTCVTNTTANPNFETDLTGWLTSSGTDLSVGRALVSGNYVATGLRNTAAASAIRSTNIPVTINVGDTYTASATVTTTAAQNIRIDVRPNASNTPTFSTTYFVPANTPQRITTSGITASSPINVTILLDGTGVSGSTVTVDNVMLTQGGQLYSYYDGNSPGWFWTGVQNESMSVGPAQ